MKVLQRKNAPFGTPSVLLPQHGGRAIIVVVNFSSFVYHGKKEFGKVSGKNKPYPDVSSRS